MLNLNQTLTLTQEKYVHDASNVLTGIFVENGHRNHMLAITNEIGNHKNQTNDAINMKNIVKLPWIRVIGPKIRKQLKKARCKVVLKPTSNL